MKECRFLESYQIERQTNEGIEFVTSYRCKLGHEITLRGCPENCLDYESQIPESNLSPKYEDINIK